MIVNTTPDLVRNAVSVRTMANLRMELDRAAQEMATGQRLDTLAATKGRGASLFEAKSALDGIEAGRGRMALIATRYEAASNALATVRSLAETVRADAYTAVSASDGVSGSGFAAEGAKAALGAAFDAMRTSVQGRAIFAGRDGSGAVVSPAGDVLADLEAALAAAPAGTNSATVVSDFFAAGGSFETTHYLGGAEKEGELLESGQRLSAMPSAVSASLRETFSGLSMVALSADLPPEDRAGLLREGAERLRAGKDAVIRDEASIGRSLQEVDREAGRLSQRKLEAETLIDSILGRDPFEAASEVQALETRLQAAYTIAGRVSQLRFANFLR
jgi:flagellar hook-associated protein 3 FlgL